MPLLVCPLSKVHALAAQWRPDHVVSLLDPGRPFPELPDVGRDRHLRLSFHDVHVSDENSAGPSAAHVEGLLAFLQRCSPGDRTLIHCRAGIGRSTAAAFITGCYQHPGTPEHQLAFTLRRAAPHARPNEALIAIADTLMARAGRMSAAIADTGRGLPWPDVAEGIPFELRITQ